MSGMARSFRKGSETIGTWFGLSKSSSDQIIGRYPGYGTTKRGPTGDMTVPSTDTASNLQSQEDQLRNKQRGVLSNIYAGNNASAPVVATKQLLGG